MGKNYYAILPRGIEDGRNIIDNIYRQLCLINFLRGKHRLIPEFQYKKMTLSLLAEGQYKPVPVDFSGDELELLSLYVSDELVYLKKELKQLVREHLLAVKSNNGPGLINQFANSFPTDFPEIKGKALPVPCFARSNLFLYQQVIDKLPENPCWLEQLVQFYDFLTGENIAVTRLEPGDFLYDPAGNIKYLICYNHLTIKSDRRLILDHNLRSLARLLYQYYIEDTEKHQAKLFKQKWFEKIEGRLIEPLYFDGTSHPLYQNFQEIILDLKNQLTFSVNKKRIGVFLDVANFFSAMFTKMSRMEINFNQLLARVYGRGESRRIKKKIAVMFWPFYRDDRQREQKLSFLLTLKDYLQANGFVVIKAENKAAQAKTVVDGEVIDVDDVKLIEIMESSLQELDSILLLSGDRHFFDIIRKYEQNGKEVRVISISADSTYQQYPINFNHQYIDQYWQCIDFS